MYLSHLQVRDEIYAKKKEKFRDMWLTIVPVQSSTTGS